ncbi:zinc finger CCHC domain-containing protein 8 homolog [Hylaeus anthracinus]|uniref:zinc finger CCHC domain-containing protein 8 homolog n=1 Tax=Hylaeus anthracinus TaxID=313031 RepID=UPI0023B99C07|nr:zinc finger CCHC domain-containing protein 8 homolog [Hylaeus anthracinus]
MNSMITLGDTDDEVIELDSSQDTINDVNNDQSERSTEKNSPSYDTVDGTDTTSEDTKYKINACTSQHSDDTCISKPLFKVMFRDESVSRQYRKQIKDFLEDLIPSVVKGQENDDSLTLEVWENDKDFTSQSVEITTESEESQDTICDTLFTVDKEPKLANDIDVPTYGKKYENVFEINKPEQKLKEINEHQQKLKQKIEYQPKLMCFNCMENHNLRDCPKPRIQANINKNRKNFNSKGGSKSVRYHLDDDQKFDRMIPGQLSSNLRKALGLRDHELPRHIYRMRKLGYPPGWLEEARIQHSGLSLFNSDGVPETDPNEEPGAIFDDGDKDLYDIKKIFDFPGFNVPPPYGTRDEHRQYWESQEQNFHSKQTMLLMLKGKKADDGYKRKKLKMPNTEPRNDVSSESIAMEIEDVEEIVVESIPVDGLFVPPLPRESAVKPPEPSLQLTQPISEDSDYHSQELQFSESPERSASPSSRTNSPSLYDLENMKKRLLVEIELQESNSPANSDVLLKNNSSKSDMPPPSNEVTPEANRSRRSMINTSCGSVKSVDLGTPVLQSASPYSKLPSSEKFSKNISDVINFENLPDSTGKYEQMTGVLQKVRNTLAQLQQE